MKPAALRFDLEIKLLESGVRVKDLPEAWHAAMQADLGVVPSDDRDGCLQDAHWYSSYIGGQFQSYTIGNILSAQFYAAAFKAHPDISREIANGKFGTLIFTGTAASSHRMISLSVQPTRRCRWGRILIIFAKNTVRFVGCPLRVRNKK